MSNSKNCLIGFVCSYYAFFCVSMEFPVCANVSLHLYMLLTSFSSACFFALFNLLGFALSYSIIYHDHDHHHHYYLNVCLLSKERHKGCGSG